MPWAARGLRNGVVTSDWPRRRDEYFEEFTGPARLVGEDPAAADAARAMLTGHRPLCPTGAITSDGQTLLVDQGRCILCGRCASVFPTLFGWTPGAATARLDRRTLVVPHLPDTDLALAELRAALARRVRRLRRSVHVRHVDAGSDGSDEWEVQALLNPVYDAHRLGIFFTPSPRHADLLLVTGIGTFGMRAPLQRTYEAMAQPVVVIAAGSDAISGGLLGGGYTSGGGVGDIVPVDVWVPGAPASPFSLLHAILLALGRLPEGGESG